MKNLERIKAEKIIDRIQTGNFDENDVDNLFMRFRASSNENIIFREIADFVAHNDTRDRGLTNQSLEAMYYSMKYFLEYTSPKISLDISKPFPTWIKILIKYQIDKIDEEKLREKFSVGKGRLKTRIDKGFKDDKKTKKTLLKKDKLSTETLHAIQYVMSFIISKEAFSQMDLINQIINVLNQNNISFDKDKILAQADKITLCVLLLLHNSKFDYKGHKLAYCTISPEKESVPHNTNFVDQDGNRIDMDESFGNLQAQGNVVLNKDCQDLTIAYPIMSTELDVEKWCSETLFNIEPLGETNSNYLYKRLNLRKDLVISENFKLIETSA